MTETQKEKANKNVGKKHTEYNENSKPSGQGERERKIPKYPNGIVMDVCPVKR